MLEQLLEKNEMQEAAFTYSHPSHTCQPFFMACLLQKYSL